MVASAFPIFSVTVVVDDDPWSQNLRKQIEDRPYGKANERFWKWIDRRCEIRLVDAVDHPISSFTYPVMIIGRSGVIHLSKTACMPGCTARAINDVMRWWSYDLDKPEHDRLVYKYQIYQSKMKRLNSIFDWSHWSFDAGRTFKDYYTPCGDLSCSDCVQCDSWDEGFPQPVAKPESIYKVSEDDIVAWIHGGTDGLDN